MRILMMLILKKLLEAGLGEVCLKVEKNSAI